MSYVFQMLEVVKLSAFVVKGASFGDVLSLLCKESAWTILTSNFHVGRTLVGSRSTYFDRFAH